MRVMMCSPSWPRRFAAFAALAVLVGLCLVRSWVGTHLDSFTVDEPWHIVAGTTYVRSGDFSLNPEHPPLVKLWVGAAMANDFRLRAPTPLIEKAQERTWVEQTVFEDNDPVSAQRDARRGMALLNGLLLLALGVLLWWACGWAWAVGTLGFLVLEPTVAAHLPVVMTDAPLALTFAIAVVAAGLLATKWTWQRAVLCGAALGAMLAAKHSALAGVDGIVAVLFVAALAGWRTRGARASMHHVGMLGLAGCVAIAVLWGSYGFRFHAGADGSESFNRAMPEKIGELKIAHWRDGIAFADRWHLLPRAYLWGLADTVRTGVEGRGLSQHFVWGTMYTGAAPWFTWPAVLLSKVPLGLLVLVVLAGALLRHSPRSAPVRWTLWMLLGGSAFHLFALMGSSGVWGGVRHAMPLIASMAIIAGAALAEAWRRRSRVLFAAVAVLYIATAAMTLREPRLWEYHNELVGGSAGAYRYFGNEGLDLGQRFGEIRAFHDDVIRSSGEPMYSDYWMGDEQVRAAGLHYRRRVESLDDTNVEGAYSGYFVYTMSDTLPRPAWEWDPAVVFKDLVPVARFGYVGIWHGRQVRPRTRASSLYNRVADYIYKERGSDWALVATRLEEVASILPEKVDAGIELGNAYLRLGNADKAIHAYRRLRDQNKIPVDAMIRRQLDAHIARIEIAGDARTVEPLRNPWLE